jgi:hypothetical protein
MNRTEGKNKGKQKPTETEWMIEREREGSPPLAPTPPHSHKTPDLRPTLNSPSTPDP